MSVVPSPPEHQPAGSQSVRDWADITHAAPQVAATIRRYLAQLATFLAPRSVEVADISLRQLGCWLMTHTDIDSVAGIRRDDIEDFKVWLAARPVAGGKKLSGNTHRQRLRMLRAFFERIIEWDWPDARPATPSSVATSHRDPSRCPSSSTTATPPS